LVATAGSLLSGVAMASVPVKILGFITVRTATMVSTLVVLAVGVDGTVIGCAAAASLNYRKQRSIEKVFRELIQQGERDRGSRSPAGNIATVKHKPSTQF